MEIQYQVNTLQQGVELYNRGIMSATFAHRLSKDGMQHEIVCVLSEAAPIPDMVYVPAFTVAELGLMLPDTITFEDKLYTCKQNLHQGGNWAIKYRQHGPGKNVPLVYLSGENEATIRAELLIWLLENNHITATEVNQRLQSA